MKKLLVIICNEALFSISISKNIMDKIEIPANLLPKNSWEESLSFDLNLRFLLSTIEDAKHHPKLFFIIWFRYQYIQVLCHLVAIPAIPGKIKIMVE